MNKLDLSSLREYLSSKGWSLQSDYKIDNRESPHLIEAYITPDNWNININLNKFDEKIENLIKTSKVSSCFDVNKIANNVVKAVATHEIGHYKYCPRSIDNLADIFNGISKAINEFEYKKQILIDNKFPIANMFADIVDNSMNSLELKEEFFNDGQSIFYISEGDLANSSGRKISTDYALFSAINLNLIQPNKIKRELINEYYPNFDKSLINKGVKIFTGFEKLNFNDPENLSNALIDLYDETKYENKAYLFTKLIAPFIEKNNNLEELISDSEGVERFRKDKDFNRKVKKKMIDKSKGNILTGEAKYHEDNNFLGDVDALDIQYSSAAAEYNIEFKMEQLERLNLIPVGEKEWEGDFSEIDMINLKPNENGSWTFQQSVKKDPIFINEKGDFEFPDLLFLFDVSGSMHGEKYNLLLKSIYSSLYCLEESGKAADMLFNFTSFGNRTLSSGWVSYYELEKARKMYLLKPDWGGTENIEFNKLENIMNTRRSNVHTIMISDGHIAREHEVSAFMNEKIINENSTLDYISINTYETYENSFKRLAETNPFVKFQSVINPNDIVNLIIGITKKVFDD